MELKIHLLSSNQSVINRIERSISKIGYDCLVSTDIDNFYESTETQDPYYLVLDYGLAAIEEIHAFLNNILINRRPPLGLLIFSGLNGFEDFLTELSEKYTNRDIPFLFCEDSFSEDEFEELFFRLRLGRNQMIRGCLRLPKYNSIHLRRTGPILRAAREKLGLKLSHITQMANLTGFEITEKRLEKLEEDEFGSYTSCTEWLFLTQLLYESPSAASVGYECWNHLNRVREAIARKEYPFPITFTLRRNLAELARREKIESMFIESHLLINNLN